MNGNQPGNKFSQQSFTLISIGVVFAAIIAAVMLTILVFGANGRATMRQEAALLNTHAPVEVYTETDVVEVNLVDEAADDGDDAVPNAPTGATEPAELALLQAKPEPDEDHDEDSDGEDREREITELDEGYGEGSDGKDRERETGEVDPQDESYELNDHKEVETLEGHFQLSSVTIVGGGVGDRWLRVTGAQNSTLKKGSFLQHGYMPTQFTKEILTAGEDTLLLAVDQNVEWHFATWRLGGRLNLAGLRADIALEIRGGEVTLAGLRLSGFDLSGSEIEVVGDYFESGQRVVIAQMGNTIVEVRALNPAWTLEIGGSYRLPRALVQGEFIYLLQAPRIITSE